MKNKKIIITIISIIVCLVIIGSSLAYFQNTFITQNNINSEEYNITYNYSYQAPDNWIPGTSEEISMTVKNESTIPIAIRASITEEWTSKNNNKLSNTLTNGEDTVLKQINNNWYKKGLYYYYNKQLLPNEETTSIIDYITYNSNTEIKGIIGLERQLTSGINDTTSEVNLLNEAGIVTVFNSFGTGFRTWGNRSAAHPDSSLPTNFINVRRTADILEESVEYAMLQFLDAPIDNGLIDSICETVNGFIRTLIGRGALIDGKCSFNQAKNPTEEIANGHIVFDIEFMPPTPAEKITFESFINTELLKSLGAS